ncbi:MAG: hypothetical protein NVSMB42_24090 [Herpetosiphon sp.]
MNVDNIEAVKKVLAEVATMNLFFKIAVGSSDDSNVDFNRLRSANALEFALLQHTQ